MYVVCQLCDSPVVNMIQLYLFTIYKNTIQYK